MRHEDREEFGLLIEALASSFRAEATAALVLGYWMGLKDLELRDVERAVERALTTCKHMPRPVELRELSGEMSTDQRAVVAWDALRKTISLRGGYASVDFDDPVINATVRNLGGWSKICATPTEEFEKWTRKDFERVYASLCQSGVTAEAAAHLPGAHEIQNSAQGYLTGGPFRVATGLPPHRANVLRELSAPARLVLGGKSSGESEAAPENFGDAMAKRIAAGMAR